MSKCQNVVFAQMPLGQFRFHVIFLHTPHINLPLIHTLAFKTLAGILLYRYFFDKHPTPTPGFFIWEPAPGLILVRSHDIEHDKGNEAKACNCVLLEPSSTPKKIPVYTGTLIKFPVPSWKFQANLT